MDIKRHSTTKSLTIPPKVVIKRPEDIEARILEICMRSGSIHILRLSLLVTSVMIKEGLLGEARRMTEIRPMILLKKHHNETHAHPDQIKRILKEVR